MAAPANFPTKVAPQMAQMMQNKTQKAGNIAKVSNLNDLIKTVRVLNRNEEESTISDKMFASNINPNESEYIMSDADEELLILLEFREDVDLESISFHALPPKTESDDYSASAPKQVFLYKIDSLNKDFDDALGAKPDIKLICESKKLSSKNGHVLRLKKKAKSSIKFGKMDKIMIFITSNQDETDQTFISGIKFEGNSSAKTDMSRWNDVKCKS